MSEPDALNMHETAAEAGVAYETFRKAWRGWSTAGGDSFNGFPQPFRYPPPGKRGEYAWRKSAVAEWKHAREHALGRVRDPRPEPRPTLAALGGGARLRRERAALALMMERA